MFSKRFLKSKGFIFILGSVRVMRLGYKDPLELLTAKDTHQKMRDNRKKGSLLQLLSLKF